METPMTTHRTLFVFFCLTLGARAFADDKKSEWVSLFNGKNLEGWTPKITGYDLGENYADTFRVEDGILKVKYDKYSQFDNKFGHLFYKEKFSHYVARVEYRFVGEQCKGGPDWGYRNSGLMFHCQPPETMAKDQKFPVSIEAQFLGGNGKDPRPTLSVCTPGTNIVMGGELILKHCTQSKSKTYHGDQWVTAEIEVHGSGKVKHVINGETVIEYEQPQYDERDADAKKLIKDKKLLIEEGYLSLQAESHPVEFRKVEIKVLEK
jgi:hypothetical protein